MRSKRLKQIRKSLVSVAQTYRGVDMSAYTNLINAALLLDQIIIADRQVPTRKRPESTPAREILFDTITTSNGD